MHHFHRFKPTNRFPMVFAHRGVHHEAPENSLKAFEEAIQMGCHGIELDLRFTASRDIVVFHDRVLLRMTGKLGRISRRTITELKNIYLKGDPNHPIPSLEDVLDILRDRVLINLDIKPHPLYLDGLEEKLVKTLRRFKLAENVLISSFSVRVLKKIRALAPEFLLGFIYRHRIYSWFVDKQLLHSFHPHHHLIRSSYVDSLHRQGVAVHVWTVDRPSVMRKVIRAGVDAIITNRPEVYFQVIEEMRSPVSLSTSQP